MRDSPSVEKWVVYETVSGQNVGIMSVCTASEWTKIETTQPGMHRIVRDDITDETEAEKLGRGTSGDLKDRKKAPRPTFK